MEPGEPIRSDYQAALIAFTVARALGGKDYRGELKDFLLQFNIEKESLTDEEIGAMNKMYMRLALGSSKK